jgi:adenine/guanine phosphoribosyltransferase-like PRPP-binding protein
MREGSVMIHYDMHLGLSDLQDVVDQAVDAVKPYAADFDSIVTEGLSGMVVAIPVALALDKPVVIVRKDDPRDRCFHTRQVEGARDAGTRTLFIDDHVDLGRTLGHVQEELAKHAPRCRIVGAYVYEDDRMVMI